MVLRRVYAGQVSCFHPLRQCALSLFHANQMSREPVLPRIIATETARLPKKPALQEPAAAAALDCGVVDDVGIDPGTELSGTDGTFLWRT